VIVTNGFVAEPVWWQIVTRPAYPYPELGPELCDFKGAELAAHTRTPATLNTLKRVNSLRRIDPLSSTLVRERLPYQVSPVFPPRHDLNLGSPCCRSVLSGGRVAPPSRRVALPPAHTRSAEGR
jgi:hypothetical protein